MNYSEDDKDENSKIMWSAYTADSLRYQKHLLDYLTLANAGIVDYNKLDLVISSYRILANSRNLLYVNCFSDDESAKNKGP